jgi:tetratricopeptide (TPR) repeat protein
MAHLHGVRQAAEEQYNALSDLAGWLAGVKSRDEALKTGGGSGDGGGAANLALPPPPVRQVVQPTADTGVAPTASQPALSEAGQAALPPLQSAAAATTDALRARGNALYKRGDVAGAADAYTAAMAAAREAGDDAAAALALGNRAQARLSLKQHAAAASDCTVALRLDAGCASAKLWVRRAAALNATGRHGAAAGDLRVAVALLQRQQIDREATQPAAAATIDSSIAEATRELARTETLAAAAAARAPQRPVGVDVELGL